MRCVCVGEHQLRVLLPSSALALLVEVCPQKQGKAAFNGLEAVGWAQRACGATCLCQVPEPLFSLAKEMWPVCPPTGRLISIR